MVLLARKDEEGNTQTLYDHLHGAGRLASGFEDEFADISRTAAVLHDVGKVAQQFQTYLLSDFRGSAEDIACFVKKIKSLGMSKDSIYFYLGLLVKLIYSRLVDADRTDAACFET